MRTFKEILSESKQFMVGDSVELLKDFEWDDDGESVGWEKGTRGEVLKVMGKKIKVEMPVDYKIVISAKLFKKVKK